jgi:hypothetical protein
MLKNIFFATVTVLAISIGASNAWSADQSKPLTADSTVAELMDNPKSKEVLTKYVPEIVSDPRIGDENTRANTLRGLQQYAPTLTDEKLKEIDAELAKIK